MTNKEFAFKYAGKEFMFYGDRVILVGYSSELPGSVIVSPATLKVRNFVCFWESLGTTDVITHRGKRTTFRYAHMKWLVPVTEEKPQTVSEVKTMTPGECIAYYEGQQGMNYSVVNGCVSAVYKRQGSALKLVSRGDSINNVTEKI